MDVPEWIVKRDALAAIEDIETPGTDRASWRARKVLATQESVIVEYVDDDFSSTAFRITVKVEKL